MFGGRRFSSVHDRFFSFLAPEIKAILSATEVQDWHLKLKAPVAFVIFWDLLSMPIAQSPIVRLSSSMFRLMALATPALFVSFYVLPSNPKSPTRPNVQSTVDHPQSTKEAFLKLVD